MTNPNSPPSAAELLSALVDGEMHDGDIDLALLACRGDDALLERWDTYHLIGDALRFPAATVQFTGADFHKRFAQRLAHEPDSVAHPLLPGRTLLAPGEVASLEPRHRPAANDESFRWKLLAGFASLTAVSAISWGLFTAATPGRAQLAVAPSAEQVLISTPQGALVRDARLHEWLEAHRQLGSSPTQLPSGFLRSATFETPPGNAGR